MKCIASFVLLVASLIATTYARKEVARPKINNCYFALYDDNRATLTSCTKDVDTYVIPANVEYQNKKYDVTIVQANAFNGRNINTISVASGNKALLLKRNAFNGISYLRKFNFYSKKTEPEIDAFPRNGILTHFSGEGIPYAMEKLIPKYLKKWKLPVGKDYTNVSGRDTMKDLFLLANNFQRNFGIYDKSTSLNSAVDIAFNGVGNVEAYPRLYRVFALTMGIPENRIVVGRDTIHQCWIYIQVEKFSTQKNKWYVIDASKYIEEDIVLGTGYFQLEKDFINNTLKPFYGSAYTLKPHDFMVFVNKYNYDGESGPNYNITFDNWLLRNGGGIRTL